jgi:hypothetical protein
MQRSNAPAAAEGRSSRSVLQGMRFGCVSASGAARGMRSSCEASDWLSDSEVAYVTYADVCYVC